MNIPIVPTSASILLGGIAGHSLNSIFLDNMEADLERLKKINDVVAIMPEEMRERAEIRHVDVLIILPPAYRKDCGTACERITLDNTPVAAPHRRY